MQEGGLFNKDDDGGRGLWISGPFHIEAETRDAEGNAWGVLVRWKDRDHAEHEEVFSRSMFAGDAAELRARFADGGLSLNAAPFARQALAEYLNSAGSPQRARSVNRVGWHLFNGRRVFVLPGAVFGETDERVVLQNTDRENSVFHSGGTLSDWQNAVARLCVGNSRLMFSAAVGFAAPLLNLLGEDGGGFHLRGNSRLGKSTALRVAGSVCGGTLADGANGFIRNWRATGNALEAVAGAHCDCLLPLDELGQVDPKEAGEISYMLANGQGKSRANRTGQARATARFKVLFLSTGEIGLADKNAEAGKATKAGQEVRMIDLPADAGAGLGLFENCHGAEGPAAFAEELRYATRQYFGTALPAFLRFLADELTANAAGFIDDLMARIDDLCRVWLAAIPDAGGQVRSVGLRFALAGIAGELAQEAGITGWPEGHATEAALTCFRAWLAERGTVGAREDVQAVKQLRNFIARHGDARFLVWGEARSSGTGGQSDDADDLPPVQRFRTQQAVGWRRWEPSEHGGFAWRYFLTSDGLDEALAGLSKREARRVLAGAGHIIPPQSGVDAQRGNLAASYAVPGFGKIRLFKLGADLLADAAGEG